MTSKTRVRKRLLQTDDSLSNSLNEFLYHGNWSLLDTVKSFKPHSISHPNSHSPWIKLSLNHPLKPHEHIAYALHALFSVYQTILLARDWLIFNIFACHVYASFYFSRVHNTIHNVEVENFDNATAHILLSYYRITVLCMFNPDVWF